MIDPATFNTLRQFRAGVYECFGARRDALFELLDAATVAGLVPSLAYVSLPPVHRRRWGSLYDALAAGDIDAPALRELVARYPLDDGQPIFALDTSVWPRDDAETSPGRGYYHSSSRQSAGQPIVTGWSYAWLAQLSFTHDSWTAPLDVQRVQAGGNAHAVAAAQISELVELDGQQVAVLVRLRSDRCFYADPPPAVGAKVGRPRRHGQKFTCAEERTWWAPTSEHREQHAQYGSVRVRAWAGVHTKTHHHPAKGSYRPKAVVRGTLVLVEVERLPRQTRIPKRLWLWWRGPGQPDLAVLWRAYAATRKSLKLSVGTIQPGHPLGLTPSRACAGSNPGVRSHEKRRRCGSHHTHSVTGARVAARGSRERESASKRLPKPRDRHTGCKVTAQMAIYANRSQPQPRRQQA